MEITYSSPCYRTSLQFYLVLDLIHIRGDRHGLDHLSDRHRYVTELIFSSGLSRAYPQLSPRLNGSLLEPNLKKLVDAPHILLRGFIVPVQPDGPSKVALSPIVVFHHLKKHAAQIEDFR